MIAVEPTPSLNPGAMMARVRKDKKTKGSKGKRWSMEDALRELGPRPEAPGLSQRLATAKANPTARDVDEGLREVLAVLSLPPELDDKRRAVVRAWLRRGWSLNEDILPAIRLELGKGPRRRQVTSLAPFTARIRAHTNSKHAAERRAIAALDSKRKEWDRQHRAIMAKGGKQKATKDAAMVQRMPPEYRAHAQLQETSGGETIEHKIRGDVRWNVEKQEVERQTIGVARRRKFDAETAMDWTPDQTESAEQIRAAWATIVSEVSVRGMSYADERVDASYRPPVAPPDAVTSDASTHYTTWKEMCVILDIDVAAVLAVVAEGYTARTVDRARNRRHGWASEQTRRGLDLWRPARKNMRLWLQRPKRVRSLRDWLSTILMVTGLPRRGALLIVHSAQRRAGLRRLILDIRGEECARSTSVVVVPDLEAAGFLVGCVVPTVVDCTYEAAVTAPLFRMVSDLAGTSNASADTIRAHARTGKRHA